MLNRVRTGILLGSLALLLIVARLLVVEGPLDLLSMCLFGPGDTRYAPGYSDWRFVRIMVGDSSERVRSVLGEPLWKRSPGERRELYWGYTESPTDTHYHLRVLHFDERGVLIEKEAEFYVD